MSACAVRKILEIQEDAECVVLGTVYKEQRLRPSILDEYTKGRGGRGVVGLSNFCSDDDVAILEDEGSRVRLGGGNLPVSQVVTGAGQTAGVRPAGDSLRIM